MRLLDGEPECGPWRATTAEELLDLLLAGPGPAAGPRVVGVDGRGGSGKTVLAGALAEAAANRGAAAAVVHTDDVAWHHSFFGWDADLAEHVLRPVRAGRGAAYRPPAWRERDRPGAVAVPPGADLVLVEGTGVVRGSLVPLFDATVWVQVDREVALARLRERDGDGPEIRAFIADWEREEEPLLRAERPWARCTCAVGTTPDGGLLLGRPAAG